MFGTRDKSKAALAKTNYNQQILENLSNQDLAQIQTSIGAINTTIESINQNLLFQGQKIQDLEIANQENVILLQNISNQITSLTQSDGDLTESINSITTEINQIISRIEQLEGASQ